MNHPVICKYCSEVFSIRPGDFYEYGAEETIGLFECPYCNKINSVYYKYYPSFNCKIPDEDDLRDFDPEKGDFRAAI